MWVDWVLNALKESYYSGAFQDPTALLFELGVETPSFGPLSFQDCLVGSRGWSGSSSFDCLSFQDCLIGSADLGDSSSVTISTLACHAGFGEAFFHFGFLELLGELHDVAVLDGFDVVRGVAHAVVSDATLGEIIGADLFGAIA